MQFACCPVFFTTSFMDELPYEIRLALFLQARYYAVSNKKLKADGPMRNSCYPFVYGF